ncbi:MAG TPA: DUF3467 domain-containing protein [Propionibacterium sp.]|nr:DUF3467 domain-containing protein [Propionibacterium sp.]
MSQDSQPEVNITVPPEVLAGVPVDFAGVWRTQETLVVDFSVQSEPTSPGPTGAPTLTAVTVARVRVPIAQGFELMKALNTQLTAWEKEHPERRH